MTRSWSVLLTTSATKSALQSEASPPKGLAIDPDWSSRKMKHVGFWRLISAEYGIQILLRGLCSNSTKRAWRIARWRLRASPQRPTAHGVALRASQVTAMRSHQGWAKDETMTASVSAPHATSRAAMTIALANTLGGARTIGLALPRGAGLVPLPGAVGPPLCHG